MVGDINDDDYQIAINTTDAFPVTQIKDQGIDTLPDGVPYSLANNNISIITEIPDSQIDKIELYLGDAKLMSYSSAYLYNKNLTIEYELTEDAQFNLNDVYGFNIDSIDDLSENLGSYAGFAQIYGVVKLDGTVIANGNSGLLGDKENLKISVKSASGEVVDYEKELTKGALYSVIFDYQMISPHDIAESYSKLPSNVSEQSKINESNIYGSKCLMDTMTLMGKTYFSQIDTNNEAVSQLSDVYYERSISVAVVEFMPNIYYQSGFTMLNKKGKLGIDVLGNKTTFISKSNNTEEESSLYHSTGLLSSYYESETLKQFTGQYAISTAEVFNIADENGIDILYLSKANIDELESSKLSQTNKTDIKKYIEAGNYVTVPAEEITLDSWSGTGYIVYDPSTGASTYIINNNLRGGSLVSWVGLAYLCDICFTVVECSWAFDIIMLGATILGAGLVLLSGPIGVASAIGLVAAAIGLGGIVAGGVYLKKIGDRFFDATMLMDGYVDGNAEAGERLKVHALFHGGGIAVGIVGGKLIGAGFSKAAKVWSNPTVAPFFKVWAMDKVDIAVAKTFENIPGGIITLTEIMARISPKYAEVFMDIVIMYSESAAIAFNKIFISGGLKKTEETIYKYKNNQYYRDIIDEKGIVNLYGQEVYVPTQSGKDILNSIDSRLNNPNTNAGELLEANVANYIKNNGLDTVDQFGLEICEYVNGKKGRKIGDIDVATSKYFIEVKSKVSDLKSGQINKYVDVFDKQFFNFQNKKVIVYINEKNINYNDANIKKIQSMGVPIVNSFEDLAEVMK